MLPHEITDKAKESAIARKFAKIRAVITVAFVKILISKSAGLVLSQ